MMMDNKAVNELTGVLYEMISKYNFEDYEGIALVTATKSLEAFPRWTPIKYRPMTDEEREFYKLTEEDGDDVSWIYDCPLPDGGDTVLITTPWGIQLALFCVDDNYGSYFECYEDKGDVLAWMTLPKRYEEGKYDDSDYAS